MRTQFEMEKDYEREGSSPAAQLAAVGRARARLKLTMDLWLDFAPEDDLSEIRTDIAALDNVITLLSRMRRAN